MKHLIAFSSYGNEFGQLFEGNMIFLVLLPSFSHLFDNRGYQEVF